MKSEEVHELPSDEVQQEQSWLHAARTTRLSGEEHTEQRKQQKIPRALPFSWNLPRQKQKPTPHFAWSKRLYSDFTNPLFINTFVPVHFYFKYELLPKCRIYAFKDSYFSFYQGTTIFPCPWRVLSGIIHMYQNTAVPLLFSFIFFA